MRLVSVLVMILAAEVSHSASCWQKAGQWASTYTPIASAHSVSPELVRAVIAAESCGKQGARSHKNAQGLMQLIPATAMRFGVTDAYKPEQNITGGVRYLRWLLDYFDGDIAKALAGYNAGEGKVIKHGGIPPYRETRNYVAKILRLLGKTQIDANRRNQDANSGLYSLDQKRRAILKSALRASPNLSLSQLQQAQ